MSTINVFFPDRMDFVLSDELYPPPPLTDEQMRHIAEQYQRDAIASAQSTMPDDGAGEEA